MLLELQICPVLHTVVRQKHMRVSGTTCQGYLNKHWLRNKLYSCTYSVSGEHVCAQRLFTGHQRTVQETKKTYM